MYISKHHMIFDAILQEFKPHTSFSTRTALVSSSFMMYYLMIFPNNLYSQYMQLK